MSHPTIVPDSANAELDARDEQHAAYWTAFDENFRDFQAYDTTHCRECGGVTAGTRVGGEHVQLCDKCLSAELTRVLADIHAGSAA